jgi:superfamily II DNA or RNA helicase
MMEIIVDKHFHVTKYTHSFSVTFPSPRALAMLLKFCVKFVQINYIKVGNKQSTVQKTYAWKNKASTEFRFHIAQYTEFLKTLAYEYFDDSMYEVSTVDSYTAAKFDIKLNPGWDLRDYQQEVVDFCTAKYEGDFNSRLISLPTGTGKGISSLATAANLGERVFVLVLPKYIEKWAEEITSVLNVKPKEVMTVQGGDQLKGLISLAADGQLNSKFIICSLTTFMYFLEAYSNSVEEFANSGYECKPCDFARIIKAGTMIVDEGHQHFHAVFKALTHMHINNLIFLTATLVSQDPFLKRMYHLIFPKQIRFDKIEMKKYIKLYPISYEISNIANSKIRTSTFGSNNYNHIEFEKSISKNVDKRDNYFMMLNRLVQETYIDGKMEGDKLVVFCGSIDMCTEYTKVLKDRYPDLDVRRYVEDDPYENIIEADIRVTTVQSGGTAIDIPKLRVAIMTVSIDSPVSNLQALGRLRELKDRDVKFYYLYCVQIPKQVQYHRNRKLLFEPKVASVVELHYPTLI